MNIKLKVVLYTILQILVLYPLRFLDTAKLKMQGFILKIKQGRVFTNRPPTEVEQMEMVTLSQRDMDWPMMLRHIRITGALTFIWTTLYGEDGHLDKRSYAIFSLTFRPIVGVVPPKELDKLFAEEITFSDIELFVAISDRIPYNEENGLVKHKLAFNGDESELLKLERFMEEGYFGQLPPLKGIERWITNLFH